MLINDYKLEVAMEGGCCFCWYKATALLSTDIGKELTKLTSLIETARYIPEENRVRFFKDQALISVYSRRIVIELAQNADQARSMMEWVKEMINRKYSERE
jgi:ArsR family metal-binding transcriptional regulator